MSSSGLEKRFEGRFSYYTGPSQEYFENYNKSNATVESLQTAEAVIRTQRENLDKLLTVADSAVIGITRLQELTGIIQVNNIPRPTEDVRQSGAKSAGYLKLTIEFLAAGMLHFMEATYNMNKDHDKKDKVIKMLAEADREIQLLGELEELDINELSPLATVATTTSDGTSNRPTDLPSPPLTSPEPRLLSPGPSKDSDRRKKEHKGDKSRPSSDKSSPRKH